jgi:hypothetical protein
MQRATFGQPMQMAEIDFLGGIAHELWKNDAQLETPKAQLRSEWDRICTGPMEWGDDKEAQWVAVTDHCREQYGAVCSLHQMFSAVHACPMSLQLNHNLLANVLNVMQDGEFESLNEDACRQTSEESALMGEGVGNAMAPEVMGICSRGEPRKSTLSWFWGCDADPHKHTLNACEPA